ncbi:AI-2E family transporter [Paenibacillus shunpengii]|uniref:AI-2E family transporter n=1 Tax=Paenibacillus shunpengii TaxID=2054424 RepID=A0ABW5SQE4_9BACL|nr:MULTISPECIES: AI-2E family transporter [unclassified Paenibacillus]OMC65355.1 AI-2E family transporter [Paenibacillus sp. FSL H7-0326]SDX18007.1 Predicted PurR-regulated permease PerM [Paenibacillus sp. PDC88]
MEQEKVWPDRFKRFFLNNKFVLFLLVVLLVGLNVMVFSKISFIFLPIEVLLKTIILPIILTGVVYYLLNPIVDMLERRRVKRVYSILILYLLIAAIITIVVLAVIPVVRQQITDLVKNFPVYYENVVQQFEQFIGTGYLTQIENTLRINFNDIVGSLSERVSTIVDSTVTGIGGFLGVLTETILAIITVPFILFYLLKDGKKLPGYLLSFLPTNIRGGTSRVLSESNHQISSYIRGQIIVSFCIGVLLYIGYIIIGLDYALILAVIAACTAIVPYLGPAIAITPALIVAAVTSPIMLLKMIAVWTIVQLVEGKFISPQIMGKSLKVHPITIIFVILTAGNLFGVVGILLAVPGYAVLKVVFTHLFNWFKNQSGLYGPESREDSYKR